MYYNAKTIRKLVGNNEIKIEPYSQEFQGPNLYYCHLGSNLLIPKSDRLADTAQLDDDLYEKKEIEEYYDLRPGEFILAETFETFSTDKKHAIRLFNSSSLARLGIAHCAAGMINPGCGLKVPVRLTLELVNTGPFIVRLHPTVQNKLTGELEKVGTEVLKVAVISHEEVDVAYEDWSGSLYGSDENVSGSKIDRRSQ